MFPLRHLAATLVALAGLIFAPFSVHASQSYDNCVGFIDTLPATITTQGVWCLRHDLSTAIASGNAVVINTNNVTIDCNDFKLGGLAAGSATQTNGIHALNRLNATVRHCNIRGFVKGVFFEGTGGGHVLEDNRFDGNTFIGLDVRGDGSVVRRNQVTDTGGSTVITGNAYGIWTGGAVDVLDNTVSGVLATAVNGDSGAFGIRTVGNPSGSISGNRVRGLVSQGTGTANGIFSTTSGRIGLVGNSVVGDGRANSRGLTCSNSSGRAIRNIVSGFATGIDICSNDGNVLAP